MAITNLSNISMGQNFLLINSFYPCCNPTMGNTIFIFIFAGMQMKNKRKVN